MVISITFDAQAACGIAPPMTAWLASKIQRARPEIPVQIPVISKMLMRQEHHVPAAILCRCRPVKKDRCTMSLARSVIPCAAIFVVIALAGCQKQTVSAAPDPQKSLCDQAAASALAVTPDGKWRATNSGLAVAWYRSLPRERRLQPAIGFSALVTAAITWPRASQSAVNS